MINNIKNYINVFNLKENKLKEIEDQYYSLVENVTDGVLIVQDKIIKYANKRVVEMSGYHIEELTGMSIFNLVTPDCVPALKERLSKREQNQCVPEVFHTQMLCKDKTIREFETSGKMFKYEGRPAFIAAGRDITERKQIEYELRASECNFRHSLDHSPLGVRISTIDGKTIYANKAILDIYGYDGIDELKSTLLKDRYTPESYTAWQERNNQRKNGEFGPSEYEISIIRKDGEVRHLHVFRKEIFWNGEKQFQAIYQDITHRKQAAEKLQATLENLRQSIKATIQVLGLALEAKDPYSSGHQKRVSDLARAIAREMGLSHDVVEGIRMACSIHDIGKLSVPGEILSKPTKLTDLEFSLVKQHPETGYEMLKHVESPWPLALIVQQHHERMDGTGYPHNLKSNEIIIEARIMAVADVVEAISSHRPYRPALGIEAALEEIEKNKGRLYDETVVDTCLKLFKEKGYQFE